MGGNVCKELGLKPSKTIGTKDIEALWNGYSNGKKTLTKEESMRFLKQFAKAVDIKYDKTMAERWFEEAKLSKDSTELDFDNFLHLFALVVKESEATESSGVKLSSTLTGQLDFALDLPAEDAPVLTGPTITLTLVDYVVSPLPHRYFLRQPESKKLTVQTDMKMSDLLALVGACDAWAKATTLEDRWDQTTMEQPWPHPYSATIQEAGLKDGDTIIAQKGFSAGPEKKISKSKR
eukprot:TRINITY_DN24615_c0_g1_i1.p1 TRINITY_DN24615_c0_g1~~TRINITY_DN24615_c0_g1_i1.p1  ORF type:complete len:235 (-),score=51.17 TRINITY_DN24615_c0_g1_i1:49-753(-)